MLEVWRMVKFGRLTDQDIIDKNMASMMSKTEANDLKAEAAKYGFKRAMSLYGVLTNVDTKKSEYRRIEILANKPYSADDIEYIHRFFRETKPTQTYTIWIYHNIDKAVALIGGFN
jgi:hypothetical protein